MEDDSVKVAYLRRGGPSLSPGLPSDTSAIAHILKSNDTPPSSLRASTGRRSLPFNPVALMAYKDLNPYHGACIGAIVATTVGLGFKTEEDKKKPEKVPGTLPATSVRKWTLEDVHTILKANEEPAKASTILDPLCGDSPTFLQVLQAAMEQRAELANGYIEVVRDDGGAISGIYTFPASCVSVFVEKGGYDFHYEVDTAVNYESGGRSVTKFARFGESDRLRQQGIIPDDVSLSELIHLKRTNAENRFFGKPAYLGAINSMELYTLVQQYMYDFFFNRGVPEHAIFFSGGISPQVFKKIEENLSSGVGPTNQFKSIIADIGNAEASIHELASKDLGEEFFRSMSDSLASQIVSSHRVPPALAGILIPGKVGAANEIVNALLAFHHLVISQLQKELVDLLGCTLGNPELNGGLGLTRDDFELASVLDRIDIGGADVATRQRTPATADPRGDEEGLRD